MSDVEVRRIDGQRAGLRRDAVEALRAGLQGKLVLRGDSGYEEARRVYNAMIDRHPAMIAQCTDVADVMAAVRFAREHRILTAVRGGGHSGAGFGTCDGGLVIDLSPMKGVRVDPEARTVRLGAGCVWSDVDHATQPFDLAVPSGIVSSTGVGGLTLGGGHGYLTRKYGLTVDSLLAVDLVLADGRFVTASAAEHEDLFWAVRGGGGNFGVATSFLFKAHPVSAVYAGPTLWHLDEAADAMRWYRGLMADAPEDFYGFFMFLNVPPGPPFPEPLHHQTMCGIVWCVVGPPEQAEQALAPLDSFRPPAFQHIESMPIATLNSLFNPLLPPGLQWYWKGQFFDELSDEAIDVHVRYGGALPTQLSTMHLYPIDGAAHRVGPEETAFRYRGARFSAAIAGIDPDPEKKEAITTWARDYSRALQPHSSGGGYVNFMMEEGTDRVHASYASNYDRLARIKRTYDPENFFRLNHNIAGFG